MTQQEKHSEMRAGFAEVEWTPEPGHRLIGQMHERIATHARDPLCACAAAFRWRKKTVVMVAVDICMLSNKTAALLAGRWRDAYPGQDTHFILHTTHTHVAPTGEQLFRYDGTPELAERINNAALQAAHAAVKALQPAQIFAGAGALDMMGWNRRAMFEDGTSKMYGHSEMPGFIGLEGPRDPYLPVIWAEDGEGKVLGVVTGFSTHPNCMENGTFYSADIPGAVRKHLRAALGGEAGVVYMTQSAGNTAPSILDPYGGTQPWRGEAGVERSGRYLAGEALKVMALNRDPMAPALDLAQATLHFGLRDFLDEGALAAPKPWGHAVEYYRRSREEWPAYKAANDPCPVHLSAVRLGEAVLCFNPAELFVEFGIETRAQSPGTVTMVTQLSNGYCGYVPTRKAFSRGGYETWCAPSSKLAEEAGEEMVRHLVALARGLFPKTGTVLDS